MWSISDAEKRIHQYARSPTFEITDTDHSIARMSERGITMPEVKYVLEHGHISDEGEKASRGYYTYKICGRTPDSGSRQICVVVMPNPKKPAIKIVTVMWRDQL